MRNFSTNLITLALLITFTSDTALANQTSLLNASSTLIHKNDNYQVERVSKHVVVTLKQAHRVLSTSDINGGQVDTLKYLVNFQSVEGKGHDNRFEEILSLSNQQYHQQLADTLKLDSNVMASMGTAANVSHTSYVQKQFRDLTIDAFVTAGVKGNALRTGDTAKWYQGANGNEFIKDSLSSEGSDPVKGSSFVKDSGTINIILIVNRALTPGAQAKAATVLNEAKSAALAELAIPSKQSQHLATGTGTDQYIIASPIKSSMKQLDSASGHLKLGELIGIAVREAVIEAIGLQNNLQRSDTRSVMHALGRYGLTQKTLLAELEPYLDKQQLELFRKNKTAITTSPRLVATAYAYAALLDRIEYGTLSKNIVNDVLLDQAVNVAIATSGRSDYWNSFRIDLQPVPDSQLSLFVQAVALGWQKKWSKE